MDESALPALGSTAKYPQDWTAEEVVTFLSRPRRPPPVRRFFQTDTGRAIFLDNDITGDILLDESFTKETLKEELGIRQVGLRISLWGVILELRRRYPLRSVIDLTDELLLPPPGVEEASLALEDGRSELANEDYGLHLQPETRVLKFGSLQRYADEAMLDPRVEWSGRLIPTPTMLVTREAHSVYRPDGDDVSNEDDEETSNPQQIPASRSPHLSEYDNDLDVRDTKRRRLDDTGEVHIPTGSASTLVTLSKSRHAGTSNPQPDFHIVTEDLPGMEDIPPIQGELDDVTPGEEALGSKPRHLSPRLRQRTRAVWSRRPHQPRAKTYIDRTPLTASDMALVGDDLDDTDRFVICKKVSPGTRMGAVRLMNAFLHKKSTDTAIIDGKFHLAYRHHTLRHLHRYKRDAITIINDERTQVGENIKGHIADFPNLDVRDQLYRRKSDRVQLMDAAAGNEVDLKWMDPWQQVEDDGYYQALGEKHDLLARFQEDDQFIPVHYTEGSPGLDSETERELRREQVSYERTRARMNSGNPLTQQEMEEVWNQVKDHVTGLWRERALPVLEKSRFKHWTSAQREGVRKDIVVHSIKRVNEIEQRLRTHWEGYLRSIWYSIAELRKFMIANSKVSIQDREEAIWWRDALQGKRPERPDSPLSSRFISRRKVAGGAVVGGRLTVVGVNAEGEPAVMDEEDLDDTDGDDSDDSEDEECDWGQFIVDDGTYDEGHDEIKEKNNAVLKQLKNRYRDDELAASVVLEDADYKEENPKARRRKAQQLTRAVVQNANKDIELPDAERLTEDGVNPQLQQAERKLARASSDSFKWFSNELSGVAPAGDERSTSPVAEDTIPIVNKPIKSALESTTKPTDIIANHGSDYGDTGPFIIEQGTPACQPSTPQPAIKPEPGLQPPITVDVSGVIDLTDDTPIQTPTKIANTAKVPTPGPSNATTGGRSRLLTMLEEDMLDEQTQIEIAIAESMETARRDGVRLSPSLPLVDESQVVQQDLLESPSTTSAVRPKPTERPVICQPLDMITNFWKRDLQAQYDSDPESLLTLGQFLKLERTKNSLKHILKKTLDCWDISHGKAVNTAPLGINEEERPNYDMLAKLYSTYSFPYPKGINSKMQRKQLEEMSNFSKFMRCLSKTLGEVIEYEEGRQDATLIENGGSSKKPQAAGQSPKRPISLENNANMQVISNDKESAKNKGKGKSKQTTFASMLDTDSEDDTPLSQRSLLDVVSEAEASRSGTSTPRRQRIHRTERIDQETQRIRQQNDRERTKLKARERRGLKAGQTSDLVNLGHLAKDDPIYFPSGDHPLYDFQKDGVRFLWRNIIVSEKRTGALLAHTMGMGKTRQVITVLCAIADAASSERPQTFNQIPQELREMRALIVCPPGLIQNWAEEISKWADDSLAPVHLVTQALNKSERIEAIKSWAADGTILIIGYESFTQLCRKSESLQGQDKTTSHPSTDRVDDPNAPPEEAAGIQDILLNVPTIVVADEAHKIKTKTTQVARLFRRFKTRARIAMTGSPLANDLTEYFHIMTWVDPEYAGDEAEFNNNFKLPIRDGLYINSLPDEVRESNKKQRELTTLWGPKMNRVNMKQIKGLEDTLPPKTEFLITLPLTELQFKLYGFYAKEAKRDTEEGYYSGFFDFVSQLGVLLNHPALFWKAFERRQAKKKAKLEGAAKEAGTIEVSSSDEDVGLEQSDERDVQEELDSQQAILGADRAVSNQLQAVIAATENLEDPIHSYRVQVLLRILGSCIKIKEKVLVFSQSVETLKYIGDVLDKQEIKFVRITGAVSTAKRQTITKGFNDEDSDKFVFLISTKAGGLGLNIQAASRIVVFDSQFSPQDEEQAVGRAYRLGQKKHVFVYRFRVGGTLEDVIHNNSLLKMSLAARLVDRTTPARRAKKSEAADWFRPPRYIERDKAGFESMKGKDPKVMDEFLEENWLRELVTQDMYEVHYEEPVIEEDAGEASGTKGDGVEGVSGVSDGTEQPERMDIDQITTASAITVGPTQQANVGARQTHRPDTTKNPIPPTPQPSTPNRATGNKPSVYNSTISRTAQGRENLQALMKSLAKAKEDGESSTISPSTGRIIAPQSTPTTSAGLVNASAGPSTIRDTLSQRAKRDMSAGKKRLKQLKRDQTAGPVPVPSPLVLPSHASPHVLPSQRDSDSSFQNPPTPTAPLSDRPGHRQNERSRPDSISRMISQPRTGQSSRSHRPADDARDQRMGSASHHQGSQRSRGQAPPHMQSRSRGNSPPRRQDPERSRYTHTQRPSSPRGRR
ncbi:hypothetical protein TWF730_001641 [Orbilia blumenaviensis]|uniref:Uncharacterized protein n=1 Tax=Orbilia blumenaviensis TaxID=1796055 RepID=A0AAV9UKF2_9PEZI